MRSGPGDGAAGGRFVGGGRRRVLGRWWLAEVARAVMGARALMSVLVVGAVMVWSGLSVTSLSFGAERMRSLGTLSAVLAEGGLWVPLVLVAGVFAATSVVQDRAVGRGAYLRVRGVSPAMLVLVRATASAAAAAATVVVAGAAAVAVFVVAVPWGSTQWGAEGTAADLRTGPEPALALASPVAFDAVLLTVTATAAAALTVLGAVVGAVVTNRWVVAVAPLVLSLCLELGPSLVGLDDLRALSPMTRMQPLDWPLPASATYWLLSAALVLAAGCTWVRGKEQR